MILKYAHVLLNENKVRFFQIYIDLFFINKIAVNSSILSQALFIKPMLPAVRCNFDVIFLNSLCITAICFGNFLLVNKHLKKNIAAYLEKVSHRVSESINHDKLEDFHGFLRAYTELFTKRIYETKDFT